MTTPNPNGERSEQIVMGMVDRLRVLQGSGEFPPLTRRVIAGDGLAGGGTLEQDITVQLSPEAYEIVTALAEVDISALVHKDTLEGYAKRGNVRPAAYHRDFTVMSPPSTDIVAPPIRVSAPATLRSVTVTVAEPSAVLGVDVVVAGTTVSCPAGEEFATDDIGAEYAAGEPVGVTVRATSAAGIVVSLRFEESGLS